MLYLPTWDNIILWIIVYGFSENLIISKSVATAFLDLVDYIGHAVLYGL